MAVNPAVAEQFFNYVGRHVVCLAVQIVDIDANGKPSDEERFIACSGFVMSFGKMWFFVTAGHILNALDEGIAAKRISITSCCFADYFGEGAKFKMPLPFSYEAAKKGHIDDRGIGLDIGLIYLSPLFREAFKKNSIIPICEADWIDLHTVQIAKFYLVGFPTEIVNQQTPTAPRGQSIVGNVRQVALPVRQITDRAEIPSHLIVPNSVLDWFIGKIECAKIDDIDGMSGGPIVGFSVEPDGSGRYWYVALQSAWFKSERIILACPLPIFAAIVSQLFEDHGITEENIA
jgi:hypothetical protein